MSTVLPVDTSPSLRPQPWLLHVLEVNTMNFCSFAKSSIHPSSDPSSPELLLAVPNTISSETVDIFHLPTSKRIHTIPASTKFKGGMIMALSIFYHPSNNNLTVVAGYESGHTSISQLQTTNTSSLIWRTLYVNQTHTQPILSLDVDTRNEFYITSSVDAMVVKHPIAMNMIGGTGRDDMPLKVLKTGHAGQQSLRIRNDGKIFATAGWDGRIRVYGVKGMKELAVLKWHGEGVYSVDFAEIISEKETEGGDGKELVKSLRSLTVKEERNWKAKMGHWLVGGSKDGKVSLWDIY